MSFHAGIGYGGLLILLYSCMTYIIILAWALLYLVFSFSSQLPWSSCSNDWNTGAKVDLCHRVDNKLCMIHWCYHIRQMTGSLPWTVAVTANYRPFSLHTFWLIIKKHRSKDEHFSNLPLRIFFKLWIVVTQKLSLYFKGHSGKSELIWICKKKCMQMETALICRGTKLQSSNSVCLLSASLTHIYQ